MILEANLYDNFSPNTLDIQDYILPNGQPYNRPLPSPKKTVQVMNYELWETGYEYTSTAVLSIAPIVGDILEVKFPEMRTIEPAEGIKVNHPLSFIYLITNVDNSNKCTLKNYFWAMVEGVEFHIKSIKGGLGMGLSNVLSNDRNALINHGFYLNSNLLEKEIRWSLKDKMITATKFSKQLFRQLKFQVVPLIINDSGFAQLKGVYYSLIFDFCGREYKRKPIVTRIESKHNVSKAIETVIERSEYNFLTVLYEDENANPTDVYKTFTIDDDNNIVEMTNYKGNGQELPKQRVVKTMTVTKDMTAEEIKNEISNSTVITKLYFNQNQLLPLKVNDLAHIWYDGLKYEGYIADRCFTVNGERLLFVEGIR